MAIVLETFVTGPLEVNTPVLTDTKNRKSVVIDPGGQTDEIFKSIYKQEAQLNAILLTHAHFDHIAGLTALASEGAGPSLEIMMHEGDQYLIDNADTQAARFGMSITPKFPKFTRKVKNNDVLSFGNIKLQVLHTPGHSPGSVCYYLESEKKVFSGDTVFQGSIGRTDLWGGNFQTLIQSIRRQIFTLPDDTIIVPGHGPETSVGREKAQNPFFQ